MSLTMLVTGGHGFLGRRVRRLATEAGWHVHAPASSDLDIRLDDAVSALVRDVRPDAIVHLAYRRSERDTIVDGSANVARAAADSGARLVHLSTDVVFGGRDAPYVEADTPHPVESYGAAKADAEETVAEVAPDAVLVRTSLLLGDDDDPGRPELDVVDAVSGRTSFTFFTDEVRCPAVADDVARAVVLLSGNLRDVRGPLHVAGPEPLDRAELARRLARRRGLDPALVTTGSSLASGALGRRPGRVVLDVGVAESLGLGCRTV